MSLIEHLGAKFSEILIEIYIFSFKKMHLKLSVAILSQPQCVKVLKIVAKRCYKWCSCGLCFESNGTWGQSRGRHTHHVVTKILGMTVIKVSFVSSPWLRFLILESMMTSSNGNIFRVTGPLCGEFTSPGEFPSQRPVTRSFDVFFDQRTYKRLSKQPWDWWFETQSWSLWRQCNGKAVCQIIWIVITFDRYNHITLRGDLSSDNTLFNTLWPHMATWTGINMGSGNGLLPDGTKPLPEPMLTYWGQRYKIYLSHKSINLAITFLQFHSNLPAANELRDEHYIHNCEWQYFSLVTALRDTNWILNQHGHRNGYHFDEIFIPGYTLSCQNDNY